MQHARNDQTFSTVLMQVTNKLHSCCDNWIQYYFACKELTSLLSYCIHSKKSAYVVWLFFLSFSDSGKYAQFNVYFSRFLITRYRTHVIYSWKGLLGELSNTYENSNYNHIICAHSVWYTALWLCYIMFPRSIEIDWKTLYHIA